jgi:hypothetical protein
MLAMVILICAVLGLMLLGLLVNKHQQAWLVSELRVRGARSVAQEPCVGRPCWRGTHGGP